MDFAHPSWEKLHAIANWNRCRDSQSHIIYREGESLEQSSKWVVSMISLPSNLRKPYGGGEINSVRFRGHREQGLLNQMSKTQTNTETNQASIGPE